MSCLLALTEVDLYVEQLNRLTVSHLGEPVQTGTGAEEGQDQFFHLTSEESKEIATNKSPSDYLYGITVKLEEDCMLKSVHGYMVLKKAGELGLVVRTEPSRAEVEAEEKQDDLLKLLLVSSLSEKEIKEEIMDITDVETVELNYQDIQAGTEAESTADTGAGTPAEKVDKKAAKKKSANLEGSLLILLELDQVLSAAEVEEISNINT